MVKSNGSRFDRSEINHMGFRIGTECHSVPIRPAVKNQIPWLHSDMKDMAFFYVYKLYEQLIEKGTLK